MAEERKKVEPIKAVAERMKKIKHTYAVMSGKGGVGKSTVATNLAAALAARGSKVGLLDMDLTGPDIALMLGIEGKRLVMGTNGIIPIKVNENLSAISVAFLLPTKHSPVVWRGPMKMGAISQLLGEVDWGELDYLIIDLPPGTSDEPLSVAQNIPNADGVIIVTTPQDVALLDVRKSISFARMLNLKVAGIIENMSGFACPHCGKEIDLFKMGGGENAANELGIKFLGRIPIEPLIVRATDSGKPFILEHKDSQAAKAFNEIVDRLLAA